MREVNDAPVLDIRGSRNLTGGMPFAFLITVQDTDLPAQDFGVYPVNPPNWLGMADGQVAGTHVVFGTPPVAAAPYTVPLTIRGGDSHGGITEKRITLNVAAPHVVWMVESSWSDTEGTLTYRLKNTSSAAITGVWVGGHLRVAVKSITKSIGTTSWHTQGNGYYGVYWKDFDLAAGAEATLVIKVERRAPGLPIAETLYCAYGPGQQPVLTTKDVFSQ